MRLAFAASRFFTSSGQPLLLLRQVSDIFCALRFRRAINASRLAPDFKYFQPGFHFLFMLSFFQYFRCFRRFHFLFAFFVQPLSSLR